jgi:hypothetical protein
LGTFAARTTRAKSRGAQRCARRSAPVSMVPIETGERHTSAHRGRAWRKRRERRSPQRRAIVEARELELRGRRLLAFVHNDSHVVWREGPAEVVRRAVSQVPKGASLTIHPGCENSCDTSVHAPDCACAGALGANSDKTGTLVNLFGQRSQSTRTKDAQPRKALHRCAVTVGVGRSRYSPKRNGVKALRGLSESLCRHHHRVPRHPPTSTLRVLSA